MGQYLTPNPGRGILSPWAGDVAALYYEEENMSDNNRITPDLSGVAPTRTQHNLARAEQALAILEVLGVSAQEVLGLTMAKDAIKIASDVNDELEEGQEQWAPIEMLDGMRDAELDDPRDSIIDDFEVAADFLHLIEERDDLTKASQPGEFPTAVGNAIDEMHKEATK